MGTAAAGLAEPQVLEQTLILLSLQVPAPRVSVTLGRLWFQLEALICLPQCGQKESIGVWDHPGRWGRVGQTLALSCWPEGRGFPVPAPPP